MAMDFTPRHRGWHSCSPLELYRVPVVKAVPEVRVLVGGCVCGVVAAVVAVVLQ